MEIEDGVIPRSSFNAQVFKQSFFFPVKEKLDKGLNFALKKKWVIMQLIVVNNNLRLGPILASSCTRLSEQQHEKTTSFFSATF